MPSSQSPRTAVRRYSAALLLVTAASLLRLGLDPILVDKGPYLVFLPAAAAAAWYGGLGPGLLATLLGAIGALAFAVAPAFSIRPETRADWLALALFLIFGVFVSALTEKLHRTKRRALDAEASERRQRLLSQQTLAGIGDAVLSTDVVGRIEFMNAIAEQLTGWTMDDARGRPVRQVFQIANEYTGAPAGDPITRVLQEGIIAGLANHTVLIKRDGSRIPIDDSGAPIRDESGNLIGAVLVFRDIAERRRAEQERERLIRELSETRDIIRSVFRKAPVGLALCDLDLRFTRVNEALVEMTGLPMEAHIGKTIDELLPGLPAEVTEAMRQVRETGTPFHHESEGETPAAPGKRRTWDIHYYPIRVDDHIAGIGAVFQEITEKKAWEAELELANDNLKQFAYAASHDLQEPLRMITSYTQLLKKRYYDKLDSDGREFLDFVMDGANRMRTLLEALRDYWRASKDGEEPATVDCNAALETALGNLRASLAETGAVITHGDLPKVVAHEAPLVQIFQNLIGNALKYQSEAQPQVHISASGHGAQCVFSVRDNGIGIDKKQLPKLFGAFRRLHGSKYPGTGMGLALCRKIVERYGGKIWVDSESNKGSTFYFTLPLASGEAASAQQS
ncbi:MAG: PAS domain-containing protein [Bryobacterales bacterium]|nr:PAS domain-containing protein [Bryobacterales bacterium]MEB2362247.1 PAS domain-containing protein [Bryobacterales bacterium]